MLKKLYISKISLNFSLNNLNAYIRPKYFSDSFGGPGNITYSGGQASEGQGGFYGSGGSRVINNAPKHHPEALAQQADINALAKIMSEVDKLEADLLTYGKEVNSKTIELKARIKKTISNPNVRAMLNRLEIKGEPVWGLSAKERDLVRAAKIKYMS
jgi:hypothetical protein